MEFALDGVISAPEGTVITLSNGGVEVSASDGSFEFPDPILFGDSYAISLASVPNDVTCTILEPTSSIVTSEVVDISVECIYGISIFLC